MPLPDQDQQRIISRMHAAGLFGGPVDVKAVVSLLRALVDALDSHFGGPAPPTGASPVSEWYGPPGARA